jgi:hypothetical protein
MAVVAHLPARVGNLATSLADYCIKSQHQEQHGG